MRFTSEAETMIGKKTLKAAFAATLPVLMGYLTMGMAAGILLSGRLQRPDTVFWGFVTSATSISGALQFALAEWFVRRTPLTDVAMLTLFLNCRYAMYGLSLLERFRAANPLKKAYLVWTLTDETYALETECRCPEGGNPLDYCFVVALLDHLYWVVGVTAGTLIGRQLPFSNRGIDFAMTALFLVILTDQCRERRNRVPAAIGAAAAIFGWAIFGTNRMLIPAMILMVTVFLAGRKRLDREPKP